MFTNAYIRTRNLLTEAVESDEGEVASWIILAALIAAAAATAGDDIATWIGEKVDDLTSN